MVLKIEKINKDKIKITLTIDELAVRKISPVEIQNDKQKAQNFFFNLLEESKLQDEFLIEGSHLFIEASIINNCFTIVVTKIFDLPDSDNYSFCNSKTVYRINSSIYEFNNINNLLLFAKKISSLNLFFGSNSLYYFNNKYYLIFSPNCIKNHAFLKTFLILSEYCDNYYKRIEQLNLIYEYGKCIFEKKALDFLSLI